MKLSELREHLVSRLKNQGSHLGVLGLGFVAGGVIFGARSCGAPEPPRGHDGHGAAAASGEAKKAEVWTCSMHPQIRQPEAGQCPICGMDLILANTDEGSDSDNPDRIVLSKRARALAKLRTSVVKRSQDATSNVRLLGRVEVNETTLKSVTAWTGGRIDRLRVRETGEQVRGGQVIATLYSPEVFAAQQDLIAARRQVKRMSAAAEPSRLAAEAALEATRQRLRLLGVSDSKLRRMEKRKRPGRSVGIHSPFKGTVMERMVSEGAYVTTGQPLFKIADLSTLWIQLDAYESDLPQLSVKQTVRVEVEAFPGESFDGVITFIAPTLDPRKRTARVRVEVKNPDGRLRPGMFAQAVVANKSAQGADAPLVIPSSAPLFTGRRAIVYVEVTEKDKTGYEPRTVRLGPRLGKNYPVVAGLSEGERVVSRGAFALDADLQIRGGASMMTRPDDRDPGKWDEAIEVPQAELKKLAPVVTAYLAIQRALADDDLTATKAAAATMAPALAKAKLARPAAAKVAWSEISPHLAGHGKHVANAGSLEQARAGFEPLSVSIVALLRRLGNPLDQPLSLAHCPMASGSKGAKWVQEGKEIDNSYFGKSMLSCGDVEQSILPSSHLPAPTDAKPQERKAAPAGGHNH